MNVYDKMKELNIELPAPAPRGGLYSPVRDLEKIWFMYLAVAR